MLILISAVVWVSPGAGFALTLRPLPAHPVSRDWGITAFNSPRAMLYIVLHFTSESRILHSTLHCVTEFNSLCPAHWLSVLHLHLCSNFQMYRSIKEFTTLRQSFICKYAPQFMIRHIQNICKKIIPTTSQCAYLLSCAKGVQQTYHCSMFMFNIHIVDCHPDSWYDLQSHCQGNSDCYTAVLHLAARHKLPIHSIRQFSAQKNLQKVCKSRQHNLR